MFDTKDYPNYTILHLKDEISIYTITSFRLKFMEIIDSTSKNLIIDLDEVTYMDSAGISVLLAAHKRLLDRNIQFALIHVPHDIFNIIKMAELNDIFKIYKTLPEE